jgi:fatty acid desaturase
LKITLTIFFFLAAWVLFVIVGNSWTTLAVAALAGFTFTQLGFIGHDAGHNQVFGTRRRNRLLGLAVGNVLIGLSFGWWVHKHNAHHAHPNEVGRDPDIGAGVPLAPLDIQGNGHRPLELWLARWQAPLFFPLMLLRSGGMHVLGAKRLLRQRDHAAAVEGSLIALHAALYLTVVLLVLSPVKALAFIAVQQAVFSVYLGFSFAPNHKGMPIIETATATSFARRQVVTARNVRGGWFTDFMLGGLNYQIEHHLFPSMPRPNLRRVQGLVRDFCATADLGYSEESFVESFRQIVHHLSDVGAASRVQALPAPRRAARPPEAAGSDGASAVTGYANEATLIWPATKKTRSPRLHRYPRGRRLSSQVSNNHHRHRRTAADADGQCFPGQAGRGAGSPHHSLASGRRGREFKSPHPNPAPRPLPLVGRGLFACRTATPRNQAASPGGWPSPHPSRWS